MELLANWWETMHVAFWSVAGSFINVDVEPCYKPECMQDKYVRRTISYEVVHSCQNSLQIITAFVG
jgi:hypothetical protein